MKDWLIYTIALLVIVLFITIWYYNDNEKIVSCVENKCGEYYVVGKFTDKKIAADIMNEINSRNKILMEHLRVKYISGEHYMDHIGSEFKDKFPRRVEQLLERYDENRIYEIDPNNVSKLTSYTENKKILHLCLRSRGNKLHNVNDVMFVVIHELSHMMNDRWGHKREFWMLFKRMLQEAVECGTYRPVNYALYPANYCGIKITYSPLYDKI